MCMCINIQVYIIYTCGNPPPNTSRTPASTFNLQKNSENAANTIKGRSQGGNMYIYIYIYMYMLFIYIYLYTSSKDGCKSSTPSVPVKVLWRVQVYMRISIKYNYILQMIYVYISIKTAIDKIHSSHKSLLRFQPGLAYTPIKWGGCIRGQCQCM